MEGPSLVIATEEFSPFLSKKVEAVDGSQLILQSIQGQRFKEVRSWGKHLILIFSHQTFRIHFLMFGSYRINNPRENRLPKLQLTIGQDQLYFYSCAIKEIEKSFAQEYDWETDLMSKSWKGARADKALLQKSGVLVCDALMDQTIFSGLGNIMKNEILFRLKMHPETKIENLSTVRRKRLVKVARDYAFDFYKWKKANVLKRNWLIMRKKKCPDCGRAVKKKATGKLQRLSHFCSFCQKKS